jgi:serine/threonine protein kinase
LPYGNRANDVWALGIILVNMISCRSPWQKAEVADDAFCEFLVNEEYFREVLPISREANLLFRKIFAYEPSDRINLRALRKEIIALPSFFMNDDELARAEDIVRDVADYCGVRVEPIRGVLHAAQQAAKKRSPTKYPHARARSDVLPVLSLDITDASEVSSFVSGEDLATPASYGVDPEPSLPELHKQLAGLGLVELIKDEVMPIAPRLRQFARALMG